MRQNRKTSSKEITYMPIKVPNNLPAVKTLTEENVFVMTDTRAMTQDIRPLQILILNLMPTKIDTETQLTRLLGNTPLQVELELLQTSSHKAQNTSEEHMLAFYKTFDQIKHKFYDGLIITGAPVELMEFEEVEYWDELCEIMEWSKSHVHSTFHICWGAQAGLYYHYGIKKHILPKKLSGVYKHHLDYSKGMLFRGFDDEFYVPHSRNTEVRREDVEKIEDLRILCAVLPVDEPLCDELPDCLARGTDGPAPGMREPCYRRILGIADIRQQMCLQHRYALLVGVVMAAIHIIRICKDKTVDSHEFPVELLEKPVQLISVHSFDIDMTRVQNPVILIPIHDLAPCSFR